MARNPGGTVSGFKLLSTPDAPTIDSVTTSIGSASVAFTAPTDVGDAAVSSYVVTAVDESTGASTGATGSASPINLPLSSGTFKIRMQALNAYGPGRLTEYDTGNVVQYSGAELWGWGRNDRGQIGDGTVVSKSSPVQVGALTNWAQVAAGYYFTASIKTDGTLWTWGRNDEGQLGDNTVVYKSSPVQVGALTNWAQVSAGEEHTVSTKTDGTLWTWGSNFRGQLGQNVTTTVSRSSPVQVGALTNWAQVSAGRENTASVKTNGTLWAWGANNRGQLGDNTVVYKSSPVQVGALTNWSQVSVGQSHTASVKTDGTMWTWGLNSSGQLGQNIATTVFRSSPVQIGALTNWAQVSAGESNTASVKTDGTLWAWGANGAGQLGDNTTISRSSPVQIGALTNWLRVSVGGSGGQNITASVKTDGTLWTWGNNTSGRLGQNIATTVLRSSPVQVGALTNWAQVSTGPHTLALYGVV